jgi:hypothetical protein
MCGLLLCKDLDPRLKSIQVSLSLKPTREIDIVSQVDLIFPWIDIFAIKVQDRPIQNIKITGID